VNAGRSTLVASPTSPARNVGFCPIAPIRTIGSKIAATTAPSHLMQLATAGRMNIAILRNRPAAFGLLAARIGRNERKTPRQRHSRRRAWQRHRSPRGAEMKRTVIGALFVIAIVFASPATAASTDPQGGSPILHATIEDGYRIEEGFFNVKIGG